MRRRRRQFESVALRRMEDGGWKQGRLNVFSTADSRMQQQRLSAVLNAPRSRSATSPKKFDFPFFNRHLYILWREIKSEEREKQKRPLSSRTPNNHQLHFFLCVCVCVITGLKNTQPSPSSSFKPFLLVLPPASFLPLLRYALKHLIFSPSDKPPSLFPEKKKAAHF